MERGRDRVQLYLYTRRRVTPRTVVTSMKIEAEQPRSAE